MIKRFFVICILVGVFVTTKNYSQTRLVKDTLSYNPENRYKISSLNIIPFSESVYINNSPLGKTDYNISYKTGILSLLNEKMKPTSDTLVIFYETVVLNLTRELRRKTLEIKYDSLKAESYTAVKRENIILSTTSFFGKGIQKSGALIRGFTIGSNQDFTINSGLRLQLSGRLSDDIEIVAALTDENTPIQPEGNTATLDELDKVFIEIRHQNAVGTFGDYTLEEKHNEFSQVNRKLQGLKGELKFENNRAVVAIASSRGKFNSAQFLGKDGNQGPYKLYGNNNEKFIIVIAGSEKVYIDGNLLKRGENNDYVIDYANSEIIFTPKILITSASRITVDYEYTDQNFNRNFIGTGYSTGFYKDKLKIGLSYYRESDDANNPIDYTYSDEDKIILQNSGGNKNNAVKSGVVIAQPDSLGRRNGIYSKVDTVINNQSYSYYSYRPGNINSIYNVSFSYVGEGKGDYSRLGLGSYKFAGINLGAYLPLIYLPIPERKQIGNFSVAAELIEGIKISAEISASNWDKNLLSNIGENENAGYARSVLLDVTPREINIGGLLIGKMGLNFKERFIEKNFSALDRFNSVEFDRHYNLYSAASNNQTLREAALYYSPHKNISLDSKYGFLKQGDEFNSNRFYNSIKYLNESGDNGEYIIDYVSSSNGSVKTKWNRHNAKAAFGVSLVKPSIEFLYDDRNENLNDELLASSYKYSEIIPGLIFTPWKYFNLAGSFSIREEHLPLNGILKKQSDALTQKYSIDFSGIKEISSSVSLAFRSKKITEEFSKLDFTNSETILFLSQTRYNLFDNLLRGDVFYQAATEQTARLEKIFVKVQKGTGNYIYSGDLNNNGIPEEFEFQPTSYEGDYLIITVPTDQLYPVLNIKTNARMQINFARVFKSEGLIAKILKPVTNETVWRIEENSKETDTRKIYLLHLSNYLNDSTTIRGNQFFQNDFFIYQNNSSFSLRLRYIQRKSLNQFSSGVERGYFKEIGLRIKFRMIDEISNQTEYIFQNDNLAAPQITNRAREVTKNDLNTDFSYRPVRHIEAGLKISTGTSSDKYTIEPLEVNQNSISLRLNISFDNIGRLRFEAERAELIASKSRVNIPFEITRGNVVGKNYFWKVFFDYKLASFVETSINYDARMHGNSKIIHVFRAEAKAYF